MQLQRDHKWRDIQLCRSGRIHKPSKRLEYDAPGRAPQWRLIPLSQQHPEVPPPAAPDVDAEMRDVQNDMDKDFLVFKEEELTYLTDEGGGKSIQLSHRQCQQASSG